MGLHAVEPMSILQMKSGMSRRGGEGRERRLEPGDGGVVI